MVLGIVGLVGIAFCGGLTLVLSPFAWAIGRKSVAEIDANPGRYGGRDKANAGKIMGIIGTVLLALGIVADHRDHRPGRGRTRTARTTSPEPVPGQGF